MFMKIWREKLEPSCFACSSVEWYIHCRVQFGGSVEVGQSYHVSQQFHSDTLPLSPSEPSPGFEHTWPVILGALKAAPEDLSPKCILTCAYFLMFDFDISKRDMAVWSASRVVALGTPFWNLFNWVGHNIYVFCLKIAKFWITQNKESREPRCYSKCGIFLRKVIG